MQKRGGVVYRQLQTLVGSTRLGPVVVNCFGCPGEVSLLVISGEVRTAPVERIGVVESLKLRALNHLHPHVTPVLTVVDVLDTVVDATVFVTVPCAQR